MSDLYSLKKAVYEANVRLFESGLAVLTWGNVSAIDREKGLVVIKPSGVDYAELKPDDMAVVYLDGTVAEGSLRPSSDTPTHLELYAAFKDIGAVVHTHSSYATAFAQAKRTIIPLRRSASDPRTDRRRTRGIRKKHRKSDNRSVRRHRSREHSRGTGGFARTFRVGQVPGQCRGQRDYSRRSRQNGVPHADARAGLCSARSTHTRQTLFP